MKQIKKIGALITIAGFLLLQVAPAWAQPPAAGGPPAVGGPGPAPGGGGPGNPYAGPPPCWPPPCIPIDGGVSILIAAGLALGGKKVYDMRKQNNKKAD